MFFIFTPGYQSCQTQIKNRTTKIEIKRKIGEWQLLAGKCQSGPYRRKLWYVAFSSSLIFLPLCICFLILNPNGQARRLQYAYAEERIV
jgi:hypothetical protein